MRNEGIGRKASFREADLSGLGSGLFSESLPYTAHAMFTEFENYVVVRRIGSLPEAIAAKSALDALGIDCFIADENAARMMISNLGGMRLFVARSDAERAATALDKDRNWTHEEPELNREPALDFKKEWHSYQKLRTRFLLMWAAYIPVFFLALVISTIIFGKGSEEQVLVPTVVAFGWIGLFLLFGRRLRHWKCPRCRRPFLSRWKGVFTSRCANCGLPKYSE